MESLMEKGKASLSWRLWAYRLGVVGCLGSALYSFALGAEPPGKSKRSDKTSFQTNKKDPIFITSDRMEVDRKKNTITYRGRVVAVQADMTMRSEVLTAHYNQDLKQLNEVIAEGKVHVTQGERVATGSKAVFSGKEQTVTLTGDPVVREGNNQVSGSRITFFIEQDRAVVEGGNQRVKATIFPEEVERREKKAAGPGKEQ